MTVSEYQRGALAEKARSKRDIDQKNAAIQALQARAERAEAGLGIGQCRNCEHWRRERSRSGLGAWGYCLLTEKIESVNWPWRGEPGQRIATKENFGCIRFVDDKADAKRRETENG